MGKLQVEVGNIVSGRFATSLSPERVTGRQGVKYSPHSERSNRSLTAESLIPMSQEASHDYRSVGWPKWVVSELIIVRVDLVFPSQP